MKISYEIYKDLPYLIKADMSEPEKLLISVTRGEGLSVRFAGEERKLCGGKAEFITAKLNDGVHTATLYTAGGAHALIPIKIAFGTAKLFTADSLLAQIHAALLEEKKKTDALDGVTRELRDAVFGKTIL